MKKVVGLVALAGMAASATISFAGQNARSGIVGSFHDINWYAPQKTGGKPEKYNRVCVYCHTPHNSNAGNKDNLLPLWNHDLPSATIYTAYDWATPSNQGTDMAIVDPLVGPSRLCMSCHDGSIAVDQHGPAMANTGSIKLEGDRAIGKSKGDVSNTHPIGFSYAAAVTARNIKDASGNDVQELVNPNESFATKITVSGDTTYNAVVRGGARSIKSVLFNGDTMTCATCHEVHNKENAIQDAASDGTATPNYFLYAKESNSLICLSCHIK